MAIEKYYVHGNHAGITYKNIYDCLLSHGGSDYFDRITVEQENNSEERTIIRGYIGNRVLLYMESYSGYIYLYSNYATVKFSRGYRYNYGPQDKFDYFYRCASGISICSDGKPVLTITKDNNGNTTIIVTESDTISTTDKTNKIAVMNVNAINDNTISFVPTLSAKTSMTPFINNDDAGSYTTDVFLTQFSQYSIGGVLDINGVKYINNGLWVVKDV